MHYYYNNYGKQSIVNSKRKCKRQNQERAPHLFHINSIDSADSKEIFVFELERREGVTR